MSELSTFERREIYQRLANYALFESAQETSVETLLAKARLSALEPGEELLTEGSPVGEVLFVLDGAVRIFHRIDAREYTPKLLAAPNHFGDLDALARLPSHRQSVEAVRRCLVAAVDWTLIEELLATDHGLCRGWLMGIAAQFVFTIDADRHNVFSDLSGRVANLLLSVGELGCADERRRPEFEVAMSRSALARHVGSVKRAVIRVLHGLEARGLVRGSEGGLVVRDREALSQLLLPNRLGLVHAQGKRRVG